MRKIDADGHVTEPRSVWTDYVEPDYRDDILQLRSDQHPYEELWADGHSLGGNPAPACIPGQYATPEDELSWDDILPGGFDPQARVAVLDEEGIDLALMFPSVYLLNGDVQTADSAAATCRAYNNWMSDFAGASERLFGMAIVPMQCPDAAVTEVKRLRGLGLSGFTIRPERYNGLALYDERCDPIWAAAEADGLAVGVHGSFGTRMEGFASNRYENPFFTHMICHPFEQMAALLDFVGGGVLSRFPGLQVGFFESGLGWLPYWLERLEEHYEVMGHLTPWLTRSPIEIFREQCFVTMEADEGPALQNVLAMDLSNCVMWGSDYPHFDCTYPGALTELEDTLGAFSADQQSAVLERNPERFLGL
jgi:predicted TIM-barrel fold metal-dependent hydrolase